ncbi:tripartite tricarboxylate transporter substrate binding protein [Bradyrhizobium sp. LHD-71]|uniref:Bug family tripartite tricarboxylate transporter substrate binding protein n=1 Tax=Bradyrhizobium sp. LHD-71 TaxID=3072141 RepID=UPI00280EC63E|nr:tripartite tricarboxylate transporter substrate binding protein [Bradyrhizobium sp. LHD-71]MDQ8727431.1 tripartite tricarboxylate transporter substrate binding protein [Bradyrhizobium sp. LHD-71]
MMSFNRRGFLVSAAAMSLGAMEIAHAQSARPIKIIVPYPAGGASDIIARLVAPELDKAMHQPFIVDNRGGGASMVGTQAVTTATTGDTIGVIDSAFVINPGLFRGKLPYDTKKDFAPISLLAMSPLVMVVHPSVQANTVKEFIALAKVQPGKLNYASAGLGTAIHLAGEQFRQAAEIDIVHVPYRGGAPAIADTLGGTVQMTFATVPAIAQQVKQGMVRALAVIGQRVSQLPDVPTMAEAGLPAVDATPLFGLIAPASLPADVVTKYSQIAATALKNDPLRSRVTALGFVPVGSTPAEFGNRINDEIEKWTRVIEKGSIQPQ